MKQKKKKRKCILNIKTTDGSKLVKISLNQTGNVSTSSYATIEKVWADHNVYENGLLGGW